ncbi:MAG: response regulator [Deltaproteobacteria bacterium]|nr:response regulator [Deltaproteobacteria bacterium]
MTDKKDDDFLKRLLATFKIEAQEHVRALSSGLIDLERASTAEKRQEMTETIFRVAHSLKGAARSVNLTDIEAICQSLESVFAALRRQEVALSPELFDLLHKAVDSLNGLLLSVGAERTASEKFRLTKLTQRLKDAAQGALPPLKEKEPEREEEPLVAPETEAYPHSVIEKPVLAETVRVPVAKLTPVLLQAEELLLAKLSASQRLAELTEINAAFVAWEREWTKVQPEIQKARYLLERKDKGDRDNKTDSRLTRLLEFLDWNQAHHKLLENKFKSATESAEHDHYAFGRTVEDLLTDTKKVLMVPFSSLLELFPKLVRDLSRDQGKEVDLTINGGEIEIDRRILEEMKDPLIHSVRNCIDHGIEDPKERKGKNKSIRGMIKISIAQKESAKIEISIGDDGRGVPVQKVRASALKLGIISEEETQKLNDREALSLIFRSGVTTSPIITDLSGRGLGLAIVREKVEKLGGVMSFETHPDAGTTLRIVLPLTLATFRGVLIRANDHAFIIPVTHVERVVRIKKEEVKTVENKETLRINGRILPLMSLCDLLELPQKENREKEKDFITALVLGSAEKNIAFSVDEVLGEQEILVKTLGRQLLRVRHISGATVLGTGRVVPILNVPDLVKSAVKATVPAKPLARRAEELETKRKSVLVVEDSITARTLLKNILESTGYKVRTAVDGVDAFAALKTEGFDLVVSDVEMPRMNGFDLTSKIRADKKLAELPVVLVTALDSREDRERGIEVGANAYIVKSSFDQSNLLEVIRRWI